MKMSKMFMPTLREVPADAEITSHQLMLRAGMIRKMASGVYNQLPMGIRVFNKIQDIIREELNKKGIQIFKPIDYFKEQADKILKKSLSDELQDNLDELMDDPFLADQITLYKYIKRNIDANYMNKDAEILEILFK